MAGLNPGDGEIPAQHHVAAWVRRSGAAPQLVGPAELPSQLAALRSEPESLLWLDVQQPRPEDGRLLEELLGFHHLTIEDALSARPRPPKLDTFPDYAFLVAHGVDLRLPGEVLETVELDLFFGPNFVVTVHHQPLGSLEAVWDDAAATGRPLAAGADLLTHAIFDRLVDDLLPVVDKLGDEIATAQEVVLREAREELLGLILRLRRDCLEFRRHVLPQADVLVRLSRGDIPWVREENRIFFRDLYDHLVRVEGLVQSTRDLAEDVLSTYLSVISNRTNQVMKVLSVVAVVFLPATLIASIYGTNFRHVPGLGSASGFWVMIGAMAFFGVGMFAFFRYRRWL